MDDRTYLLILVGALGFIVIRRYIPVLQDLSLGGRTGSANTVQTTPTIDTISTIDQIQGIDLNALALCRQNGY